MRPRSQVPAPPARELAAPLAARSRSAHAYPAPVLLAGPIHVHLPRFSRPFSRLRPIRAACPRRNRARQTHDLSTAHAHLPCVHRSRRPRRPACRLDPAPRRRHHGLRSRQRRCAVARHCAGGDASRRHRRAPRSPPVFRGPALLARRRSAAALCRRHRRHVGAHAHRRVPPLGQPVDEGRSSDFRSGCV